MLVIHCIKDCVGYEIELQYFFLISLLQKLVTLYVVLQIRIIQF